MILILIAILLIVLGVHHIVEVRRALRTGLVAGMVLGFGRNHYSRAENKKAFWVNVCAGVLAAAFGMVAAIWLALLIGFWISAYMGQPTL